MKKRILFLLSLLVLTIFSFSNEYTHKGYTTRELALVGENNAKDINWVSIEDIKKSLESVGPIIVSFDIDDTVLASSPCFFYGEKNFSEDGVKYTRNQNYWDFLGFTACDKYSLPKLSSKEIIKMHLERGDKVIFITGRTAPSNYDGKSLDALGKILKEEFNIEDMQPISYRTPETKAANKYDKTYYIKKYNVSIHYGDSDDDILAAKESNIRGIRVLRTTTSTNTSKALNGGFGEEVVRNSSY